MLISHTVTRKIKTTTLIGNILIPNSKQFKKEFSRFMQLINFICILHITLKAWIAILTMNIFCQNKEVIQIQ